jgi:hypothetical protein
MALSQALKLNIDIAYLDGRGQGGNVDFVQFRNAPDQDADPLIFLYRSAFDFPSQMAQSTHQIIHVSKAWTL